MKTTTALIMIMSFFSLAQGQHSSPKIFNLLVGTYSSPDKSGIYIYTFNAETGEFTKKAETTGIANPSFLAITRDRKHVYAVTEVDGGKGSVSAFSFDPVSGKLSHLNNASSGGDGPCYVTIDEKNRFVFVGNYSGGSLSAIPVNADGSLNNDIQTIQHTGSGVLKNQDKAHVHATVLSADDRYLFVPDLGTDKVYVYKVDYTKEKPLSPADPAFASVTDGNGPRHFIFHQNGKYAYLIQEMSGVITAFDYVDGKLASKQSVSSAPKDFSGKIDAADIHLSPDGKFLYGSLRGDINELAIYAVDKNGKLSYVGRQSTLGKIPRNFAIDPTGNFLLVANQNTNDIQIFKRDHKTGMLAPTGKKILVEKPVCLKFATVN
ncbi:MAG: lactonase family protein [Cyclobacteriaceae bacterium]|nr:lactonase family protein [Cyclobacteriaceae bacterium]MDH4295951.1 lactonase family protein [Cyclobacteriaceae bacterium]MDH5251096.1 lactonase family protein [Cyclobacteriaceae bacterium]